MTWARTFRLALAGETNAKVYFTSHFVASDTDPQVQAFVSKYRARFKGEVPGAMAALGYDSAMILADAIQRAGTTESAKLRDAIAATKEYAGVTGKTTLDANRNATKAAVILTIRNGRFEYVETVNP